MKGEIDAQARKDPGVPFVMDGGGPALSAWVAEECNRVLGRDLTEEEARGHANPAGMAKERNWTRGNIPEASDV